MILIADSGSTKTDWLLAEGGDVVMRVATQGINPYHQTADEIHNIMSGELLPQLGGQQLGMVFFYGSGCRDEVVGTLVGVLAQVFPQADTIEVHGDLLGAARSVCGGREGIACILGTGANSCLYDGNAIVMNTPPLGYILGDEGSGAVLCRNFVNALFKGRLSVSVRDAFFAESGLTLDGIIHRVYREPMANRFLASLSPFIHSHIADAGVRGIVVDNFRCFLRNNVACYNRPDIPLGVVGSIGYVYKEELVEAAEAEGMTVGRVVRSPLEGLLRFHTAAC